MILTRFPLHLQLKFPEEFALSILVTFVYLHCDFCELHLQEIGNPTVKPSEQMPVPWTWTSFCWGSFQRACFLPSWLYISESYGHRAPLLEEIPIQRQFSRALCTRESLCKEKVSRTEFYHHQCVHGSDSYFSEWLIQTFRVKSCFLYRYQPALKKYLSFTLIEVCFRKDNNTNNLLLSWTFHPWSLVLLLIVPKPS